MERVSLVKFPGFLRDPSDTTGLVAALGGEDALRLATYLGDGENPDASLSCQLRPGELSSRSNIGSVVTSAKDCESAFFVLHVFSAPESTDTDVAAVAVTEAKGLVAVVESQVEKVFSFPGIADFQLFSRHAIADVEPSLQCERSDAGSLWVHGGFLPSGAKPVPVVGTSEESGGSGAVPWREKSCAEALAESAWEFSRDARKYREEDESSELMREAADRSKWLSNMRPSRWARAVTDEGATDPWFKDFAMSACEEDPPNSQAGSVSEEDGRWQRWTPEKASLMLNVDATRVKKDGRSSSERITSLAYRVDLKVDKVPIASPYQAEPTFINARKAIDVLRERFASRPVWGRRKLLSTACENTRRHFKTAVPHVAYAFTALRGPFHSMWIRYGYDPRKNVVENLRWQTVELRLADARSTAAIEKKFGTDVRDDTDDVGNHSLAEMPSKRQLSLQLCDIVAPGLEGVLQDSSHLQQEFSVETGFLTAAGLQAVTSHLRRRVHTLVIETLGEAKFQNLVEKQAEREKSRKRARHNSNWDLIREQTQRVTVLSPVPEQPLGTSDGIAAEDESALITEQLAAELQAAGIDGLDDDGPTAEDHADSELQAADIVGLHDDGPTGEDYFAGKSSDMAREENGDIVDSHAVVEVGEKSRPAVDQDADVLRMGRGSMLATNEHSAESGGSVESALSGDREGSDEGRAEEECDEGANTAQADTIEEVPVDKNVLAKTLSTRMTKILSDDGGAESDTLAKARPSRAIEPTREESDVEGFQIFDDADVDNDSDYDEEYDDDE